jgi:hypothetical protein
MRIAGKSQENRPGKRKKETRKQAEEMKEKKA